MTNTPSGLDTIDQQIHKIMMDFRNTIQLERDRLYKTKNPDVTGVAQAHLKASKHLTALITKAAKEARIDEIEYLLQDVNNFTAKHDTKFRLKTEDFLKLRLAELNNNK